MRWTYTYFFHFIFSLLTRCRSFIIYLILTPQCRLPHLISYFIAAPMWLSVCMRWRTSNMKTRDQRSDTKWMPTVWPSWFFSCVVHQWSSCITRDRYPIASHLTGLTVRSTSFYSSWCLFCTSSAASWWLWESAAPASCKYVTIWTLAKVCMASTSER